MKLHYYCRNPSASRSPSMGKHSAKKAPAPRPPSELILTRTQKPTSDFISATASYQRPSSESLASAVASTRPTSELMSANVDLSSATPFHPTQSSGYHVSNDLPSTASEPSGSSESTSPRIQRPRERPPERPMPPPDRPPPPPVARVPSIVTTPTPVRPESSNMEQARVSNENLSARLYPALAEFDLGTPANSGRRFEKGHTRNVSDTCLATRPPRPMPPPPPPPGN